MDIETDNSVEAMDTQDVDVHAGVDLQNPNANPNPNPTAIQPIQQPLIGALSELEQQQAVENGNVLPPVATVVAAAAAAVALPPQQMLADSSSGGAGDGASCYPNEQEMTSVDELKDDQFRPEVTFSHTVGNITVLKGQALSPAVYARMLPWKIMVIPNDRALGFFVQCNGEDDAPSWSCNASADLRLKSFKAGVPPFTRARIKHLFYAKENDYGYSNFITWSELQDPDKHYVQDGCIQLEVHVTADAPHGVFWDSKKHTGYVGLKNQGATCYMNSLLQTLYFTNQLRFAVYRIPTEADDITKSVGLSLQRVFHDLQFGDRPAGTKRLTKSFGWETLDSFMQHDVQEFLRVLLDKLESKMKRTCLEGSIPALFEGKMYSYIKCKNVDYNSTRYETFLDIQLNIKDKKTIYDSFADYIASETLEGDNKYDAGAHGLQEASKGVIFTKFPPVLHLHLMRFQYDPISDNSIKFNDRLEFYEQINLDKYLAEKEETPADYVLHAVLVHSGDNHGGHYVVYINPKADGRWFKFDDDVVSSVRKSEAIQMNYGGMEDETSFHARSSNAYMLVYIRRSELANVLRDIPESEISPDLVERLELDKRIEMARRKERGEANLYVTVHVLLEEYFGSQHKRRIYDVDKVHMRIFKFKVNQLVSEVVDTLVSSFGVSEARMRLWNVCPGQVQKFTYFEHKSDAAQPLDKIAGTQKPWLIFLELAKPNVPAPLALFNSQTHLLIFMKYYDAVNGRLVYLGYCIQPIANQLCQLVAQAHELIGHEGDFELSIYDDQCEKKLTQMFDTLDNALVINEDNQHAHILVFEKEPADNKLEMPTVEDYYQDLLYRVEVTFSERSNPADAEFVIELSLRYNYEQLARAVGARLNHDPQKLQFFMSQNTYKESVGTAIPYHYKGTLKEIFPYGKPPGVKKLIYQKLTLGIHELDNKKQFKCIFVSNDLKEEKELVLYPNKSDTVGGLLQEAAKKLTAPSSTALDAGKKLRLLKVINHKIIALYSESVLLETLQKASEATSAVQSAQKQFRIEEIPPDELYLSNDEILLPVAHYSKEVHSTFGVPFLMKAKRGELYADFKKRIQRRLNVPDKEWESYRPAVVAMGHSVDASDNMPIDIEVYRNWCNAQTIFFGLDHVNKSRKRGPLNFSEKAIKIYN